MPKNAAQTHTSVHISRFSVCILARCVRKYNTPINQAGRSHFVFMCVCVWVLFLVWFRCVVYARDLFILFHHWQSIHTHTHILYTAFISLSRRGADARSALPFPCTRWPSTGRRTTIYCMRAGPRTLDGAHDGGAPHLYARPERFQFNKCFVSFIKHLFVPWPCDAYASRRRFVTRVWKLNCSGRTEPRTFGQRVKVCVWCCRCLHSSACVACV